MNFGDWMRDFMQLHSIRQVDLCKRAGFHSNLLYWWLNNRNMPSGYNFAVLATALSHLSGIARPIILDEMVVAILKT
jgi:transcriptional regulator with XRE-family HTH domain